MGRFYSTIAALMIVLFGAVLWSAQGEGGHDFSGLCAGCHATDGQGQVREDAFVASIDQLCASCHTPFLGFSHPVAVRPAMTIPGSFSLDSRGRMVCNTCHDPHAELTPENPHLLRGAERGRQFCIQCHQNSWDGPSVHAGAGLYAHPSARGQLGSQSPERMLDEGSLECIECHLDSVGPQVAFSLASVETTAATHGTGEHPVGVDYATAADANPQLRPPAFLPPELQLFDGQVGCMTCHNPYSPLPAMLSISNSGSALCLACHLK